MKYAVLLLLLLSFTVFAQNEVGPDLIAKVKPSVVSIVTYDENGSQMSQGTGFCVGKDKIVTNKHVIEKAKKIIISISTGKTYSLVEIESVDKNGDLALLKTEDLDKSVKPLFISRDTPKVGEKVFVIGNPKGLQGSASDGIVSAIRNVLGVGNLIQITAPISPGSSGSPVINLRGEVIGVATANLEGGQNLNFAISSERIINLWSSVLSVDNSNQMASGNNRFVRWRLLTGASVSYDTETHSKKLGVVSSWITYSDSDGSYSKVLTEINCNNAQIRSIRSIFYNKSGGIIPNLGSQDDRPSRWRGLVPETVGETMYKIFCKDAPDYQYILDWNRWTELIEKANELKDSKDYNGALSVYSQVIEEFDQVFELNNIYFLIGLAKKDQGKFSEAKTYINKAINIDNKASYFEALGDIFRTENNIPMAIDYYWKSLNIIKENEFFLVLMSRISLEEIYRESNNLDGLTKLYKFLISKQQIEFYVNLGDLYERRGLKTLANSTRNTGITSLKHKIKLGKAAETDYSSLAYIYKELNNDSLAIQTYESALHKFPKSTYIALNVVEIYNKNKQWEKAIKVAEGVLLNSEDNYFKESLLEELKVSYQMLNKVKDVKRVEQELSKLKQLKQ